ncbi:MAG: sulfatase-like hydrolase/transferase [Planctomycetaceae bacterium]|jgi:arylsulfatase A-like enzyme|nr:sulfatase-like hydrolase/transferase [Planctomycetaceae bacterium]
MKAISFIIVTVVLLSDMFLVSDIYAENRRPNVILIYSDDHGSLDLGCYGAKDIISPNLDDLAKHGVRFTQMYAPAPVCSASRAGLMTGKFPARAGVPGNVSIMYSRPGMPTKETTLGELFQSAGYTTGLFGKWHLGYSQDTVPSAQGFDESYGMHGGVIDSYSHYTGYEGPNRHDLWKNGKEVFEPGKYFPKRLTDECIEFIKKHREKPFFAYVAFNIAHYPVEPSVESWEDYENIEEQKVPFANEFPSTVSVRRLYASFITDMDKQIGRIIKTINDEGLRDDTIIIFQADQGSSFEERTGYGGGWSGIYRGGKFSLFEGGIRVVSIISWSGKIPENTVRNQIVSGCDWFPTLAEFCNINYPDDSLNNDLDGHSITKVITQNNASPHEHWFWYMPSGGGQQALRKGDWKLYYNPFDPSSLQKIPDEDKEIFLSNLKDDPGERINFAKKHPEIVEELKVLITQYNERLKEKK